MRGEFEKGEEEDMIVAEEELIRVSMGPTRLDRESSVSQRNSLSPRKILYYNYDSSATKNIAEVEEVKEGWGFFGQVGPVKFCWV